MQQSLTPELAVSDYVVYLESDGGELPDAFFVSGHRRDAGVWELLRRVAEAQACDESDECLIPGRLLHVAYLLADKLEEPKSGPASQSGTE